ncbi:MAG: hypothetical protein ABL903_15825 [Methylococcales bacterium]
MITQNNLLRLFSLTSFFVATALSLSGSVSAKDFTEIPSNIQNIPGPMAHSAPGASAPGADPFQLLMNNKAIQEDLRLTEAQLHHLASISGNFRTQVEESSFRSEQDIQQQIRTGQQMINRILDPRQVDRFRQIILQIEGTCGVLMDPQALHHLEIEPDSAQFQEIGSICHNMNDQIRNAGELSNRTYPNDPCSAIPVTWKQSQDIKQVAYQQITQRLTAKQQNILNEMQGRLLVIPPPFCNTNPPKGKYHERNKHR